MLRFWRKRKDDITPQLYPTPPPALIQTVATQTPPPPSVSQPDRIILAATPRREIKCGGRIVRCQTYMVKGTQVYVYLDESMSPPCWKLYATHASGNRWITAEGLEGAEFPRLKDARAALATCSYPPLDHIQKKTIKVNVNEQTYCFVHTSEYTEYDYSLLVNGILFTVQALSNDCYRAQRLTGAFNKLYQAATLKELVEEILRHQATRRSDNL